MKLKALIHVNEAARWEIALGNIANLLKAAGEDDVEIVLLANGEGVDGYVAHGRNGPKKGACSIDMADRISAMTALSKKGISFLACRNALAAQNISLDDLPQFVTVVPAGMVQLIKLRDQGFAYIKP